jgi:outer membrane protein
MRYLFVMTLGLYASLSFASPQINLLQAFQDASANDPLYQQQLAAFHAIQQDIPEKYAALLPQIDLNAALAREFRAFSTLPNDGHFNTHSFVISAEQTVFNYTQFNQLDQARYSVRAAFATLTAQQQELMSRTAKAYLDVLETREILRFTEEQKAYIKTQLEATSVLYEHREATITDLEQAKGASELIDSDLYTAQINFFDAVQTLSQITSHEYASFSNLNPRFPLQSPDPQNIEAWTASANAKNWLLVAARINIQAFKKAIDAVRGGYLPRLTAALEIDRGAVPNQILTNSMQSNDYSAGLNANWNVFEGGLTLAQEKAARANLKQSEAAMRQQYLETMANTRRAYNTILVGVSRVKSVRAALASNTKALQYAQESYRAGEASLTEILQIQFQLFTAQRQYAEYTYNYLYNILLLKQAQGTLSIKDLAQINSYLVQNKTT